MTCVELHHATGDEIGIAQQSCELGFNSCTCIPSGTLSVLTCGQKKHAIEVLGRILTTVVFFALHVDVNVLTFSPVHKLNFNASRTLKMRQERFLTKGLFFRALPQRTNSKGSASAEGASEEKLVILRVKSTNIHDFGRLAPPKQEF